MASMVMRDLHLRGLLQEGKPAKLVTLIFDNFSGQNKNNSVLRLALYLVERCFFERSRFYFMCEGTQRMHATACSTN
jgi:hypothetical protein